MEILSFKLEDFLRLSKVCTKGVILRHSLIEKYICLAMQNVCQFDLRNARVADMKPTTVRRRQTMTTRFRFTIISMLRMLVAAGIHRDGTQFGNQLVDGHPARC